MLHLTKLTEDSRVPIPGMYSQTVSVFVCAYACMCFFMCMLCVHAFVDSFVHVSMDVLCTCAYVNM